MTEKKTFDKLRQKVTYEEMIKIWDEYRPGIDPVYKINLVTFERKVQYPESTFIFDKIKILEEHGWTLENLAYESERRAVKNAVDAMNAQLAELMPQQIIDHARKFFPNLTITLPKVDLGE